MIRTLYWICVRVDMLRNIASEAGIFKDGHIGCEHALLGRLSHKLRSRHTIYQRYDSQIRDTPVCRVQTPSCVSTWDKVEFQSAAIV
jgi:hypothetical protein